MLRLMVSGVLCGALAMAGWWSCAAHAQSALVGSPPAVKHAADIGDPQNFSVVQDSRGIVYLGNGDGVLEFDGEHWRLIPMANRDTVRSLAIDANDRVYVGGYNAFGYLQRDAAGNAAIVDLTPRFAALLDGREFNDIWRVVITPEGVYFGAVRDLFFWDPQSEEIGYWRHADRFGALIHHRGQTIAQFRGEGFRHRVGDQWLPLAHTSGLTTLRLDLLPLADGTLLATGVDGRWLRIAADTVSELTMPAELPASNHFEASLALPDGSLVLGGADGRIHVVDAALQTVQHFALEAGFISGIAAANGGGVLVSADEAFYRVAWPSAWSVLGAEHGLGDLMDIGRWNGVDYLLTSSGALRLQPRPGTTPDVIKEPWGERIFTALIALDSRRALLGTGHKLLLVEDGEARELSDELIYPRSFHRSRFRPERIYIGTEAGLRFVEQRGDPLSISPLANLGLEILVTSVHESSTDELWFGSYRHGLWRVTLDEAGNIVQQQRYGADEGLAMGVFESAEIAEIDAGPMLVSTREGFYEWNGSRFDSVDLFGLSALRQPEEVLSIAGQRDGVLWAYGAYRVYRYSADSGWRLQPVDQLRRGALRNHRLHDDGRAEFVATRSLLIYAGEQGGTAAYQPQVQLRSVALSWNDGRQRDLPLHPAQPIEIDYGSYGISFQFALPDLAYPSGRAYRGRLLGYESEYSAWRGSRGYLYSRMSPGTYKLEVQARDGAGQISRIEPYTLVILAPWYRSWWAIGIATLISLLLLLWLIRRITRSRTERLAEEKRQLEETVAERTRDLAAANQRLQMMAHLDGLTGIANRRRLDQYLADSWSQCAQRGRPLALLAIDVDHFKAFNDSHGHLAGDQYLKDLMPVLERCLRRSEDLLARYGGEEFLAIMPGADAHTATEVAEAMRAQVERADLGTTISIGVASTIPNGGDPHQLIGAADEALYRAKDGGRNRVEVAAGAVPVASSSSQ